MRIYRNGVVVYNDGSSSGGIDRSYGVSIIKICVCYSNARNTGKGLDYLLRNRVVNNYQLLEYSKKSLRNGRNPLRVV